MPFLGKQPTAGFASIVKDDLTADGSTTAFTLSKQVASANDIAVFVGNVRQEPTDAYSVSGTTLTMTAAPASGINFYVLHIAGTLESSVVPAAGTTVPGDFGSERMGIGGQAFSGNEKLLVNATTTGTIAKIKSSGSGFNLDLEDATATSRIRSVGTILDLGADYTNTGVSDPRLRFRVGNSIQCSITGHGGIAFGSDTSAANTLDDYEEGTFTPIMSGGSGTITTQSATGEYVKVGTVCFIHMVLTLTNKGTASGTLFVSGLPFTSGTLRIPMIGRENATTGVTEQFVVNNDDTTGFFKATGGGNVTLANGNVRMVGGSYITV